MVMKALRLEAIDDLFLGEVNFLRKVDVCSRPW